MMLFSELYGAYYGTVARVLRAAADHPLTQEEIQQIVAQYAFGDSVMSIPTALRTERWPLIRQDGTTPIQKPPTLPLTRLQKQWLNAIAQDPRISLFMDKPLIFSDEPPLFRQEDIAVYDQYADGDDYTSEAYKRNFRLILDAIRKQYPLKITVINKKGRHGTWTVMPQRIEYSEKDDKFRLIGSGTRFGSTINLGKIVHCVPCTRPWKTGENKRYVTHPQCVVFEVTDECNALERVLFHFAHFKKQAERIDENRYRVTVEYDLDDETEIVIRILSFGPMIKVTEPQAFVDQMKSRLTAQKSCGL